MSIDIVCMESVAKPVEVHTKRIEMQVLFHSLSLNYCCSLNGYEPCIQIFIHFRTKTLHIVISDKKTHKQNPIT